MIQPKRNFGAAMRQGPEGISVEAIAPDLGMQADTTARQQAAVLAAHLQNGRRAGTQRLLQTQRQPVVHVLRPGETLPSEMLIDSHTLQALDSEWRQSHDDL